MMSRLFTWLPCERVHLPKVRELLDAAQGARPFLQLATLCSPLN